MGAWTWLGPVTLPPLPCLPFFRFTLLLLGVNLGLVDIPVLKSVAGVLVLGFVLVLVLVPLPRQRILGEEGPSPFDSSHHHQVQTSDPTAVHGPHGILKR